MHGDFPEARCARAFPVPSAGVHSGLSAVKQRQADARHLALSGSAADRARHAARPGQHHLGAQAARSAAGLHHQRCQQCIISRAQLLQQRGKNFLHFFSTSSLQLHLGVKKRKMAAGRAGGHENTRYMDTVLHCPRTAFLLQYLRSGCCPRPIRKTKRSPYVYCICFFRFFQAPFSGSGPCTSFFLQIADHAARACPRLPAAERTDGGQRRTASRLLVLFWHPQLHAKALPEHAAQRRILPHAVA